MVILIPSLVQLRDDFDFIAPRRAKDSDGWIGDARHQASLSDHNPDETGTVPIHDSDSLNEVHAIDVDVNLNQPGLTMQQCIDKILGTPKDLARLRYIIYNKRIWSLSNNWKPETYTGNDPHINHSHFSGSYLSSKESDGSPWSIRELGKEMPVSSDDVNAIWAKEAREYRDENGNGVKDTRTVLDILFATHRASLDAVDKVNQLTDTVNQLGSAENTRDAELRQLLQDHADGQLDADEVIRRMGEKLVQED